MTGLSAIVSYVLDMDSNHVFEREERLYTHGPESLPLRGSGACEVLEMFMRGGCGDASMLAMN